MLVHATHFTSPLPECDRVIRYDLFLNSILKIIAEQIRTYKNVYSTATDDCFL